METLACAIRLNTILPPESAGALPEPRRDSARVASSAHDCHRRRVHRLLQGEPHGHELPAGGRAIGASL
jgi:hypothetical protein